MSMSIKNDIARLANNIVKTETEAIHKKYEEARKEQGTSEEEGQKITVFEDGYQREYLITKDGTKILLSQKAIFWLQLADKSVEKDKDKEQQSLGEVKELHNSRSKSLMAQLNAHAPVGFNATKIK